MPSYQSSKSNFRQSALKVLFITWDGPQVFYLESLFLPIFAQLQGAGIKFHILQFTWGNDTTTNRIKSACERQGIPYDLCTIWRRPVGIGSFLTTVKGSFLIRRAVSRWKIDILMARSILPALSVLFCGKRINLPIIFDADGLPLDERVDFANMSANGLVYRFLRDVETSAIRRSAVVLTRSTAASAILHARAGAGTGLEKFNVIINGRDPDIFRFPGENARRFVRQQLGVDDSAPLLVYTGSLGKQYCLLEMVKVFEAIKSLRPESKFLILTGSPEIALRELKNYPYLADSIIIKSISPSEVPTYLSSADVGLSLRLPAFSMRAVSPVKVGEYLLSGIPIISNKSGVETGALNTDISFVLERLDQDEIDSAAHWFCALFNEREQVRVKCRSVGVKYYSLEASKISYLEAIKKLKPDLN